VISTTLEPELLMALEHWNERAVTAISLAPECALSGGSGSKNIHKWRGNIDLGISGSISGSLPAYENRSLFDITQLTGKELSMVPSMLKGGGGGWRAEGDRGCAEGGNSCRLNYRMHDLSKFMKNLRRRDADTLAQPLFFEGLGKLIFLREGQDESG
jgi:hypothetical protein